MRAGGVPAIIKRIARRTSTVVLPEPALAETQAETAGLEAFSCACRVFSGSALMCPRLRRSRTIP